MTRALPLVLGAAALAAAVAAAGACSSAPRYPACQRDDQCVSATTRDYCVAGRCVYCRTSADCADRQMCRAGACAPDPNAPPPPATDAGDDAEASDDGSADAEPLHDDDDVEPSAPPESPRRVLPRGVRRFFRP